MNKTKDTCAEGSEVLAGFRTDIIKQLDDNTTSCQWQHNTVRINTVLITDNVSATSKTTAWLWR